MKEATQESGAPQTEVTRSIRHRSSKLYLAANGGWVSDPQKSWWATDTTSAVDRILKLNLTNVELCYCSDSQLRSYGSYFTIPFW